MKLYVLRARHGVLVTSPRAPWFSTAEEKNKVQQEIAAIPGWLQIPYEVGKLGYPTLKEFLEMAYYFHMIRLFSWGLVHSQAVWSTNAALAAWIANIKIALALGVVFYLVVFPGVIMGVLWFFNPTHTESVWQDVFPPRYVFAYDRQLWWADFIGKDDDDRPYYIMCAYTGATRMTERRRVPYFGELLDMWQLGGSWLQWKHEFMHYQEWRWNTVFVDFLGVCHRVSEGVWRLQEGFSDSWQAEAPPGYVHPVPLRCKAWEEIP